MFFDLSSDRGVDHPKRTATISFRCAPGLECKLQAIANATGLTLSDLLCRISGDYAAQWEDAYLKLKQAFDENPDKQEMPEDRAHG